MVGCGTVGNGIRNGELWDCEQTLFLPLCSTSSSSELRTRISPPAFLAQEQGWDGMGWDGITPLDPSQPHLSPPRAHLAPADGGALGDPDVPLLQPGGQTETRSLLCSSSSIPAQTVLREQKHRWKC